MADSILERLREIVLFVSGLLAIGALILAAFEGFNQRVTSAAFLGTLGVACIFLLFMPKLEVFKVWGIEAKLQQTVTEAVATLAGLKRLAEISARASYLTIAWGNRLGTPPAKDKQAVLDEIDTQLRLQSTTIDTPTTAISTRRSSCVTRSYNSPSGLLRAAIEKRWASQGLNPSYELCSGARVVVSFKSSLDRGMHLS